MDAEERFALGRDSLSAGWWKLHCSRTADRTRAVPSRLDCSLVFRRYSSPENIPRMLRRFMKRIQIETNNVLAAMM